MFKNIDVNKTPDISVETCIVRGNVNLGVKSTNKLEV